MNDDSPRMRQIMFDLDTDVLRKILGANYRNVYRNLENFFVSNGFSHVQGSGYIGNKSISNTEIFNMMKRMKRKYPYIEKCFRDIRVADITDINSLNSYFDYDGTPGKYVRNETADIQSDNIEEASRKRRGR